MRHVRFGQRVGSLGLAVGLSAMMLSLPTVGVAQESTPVAGAPPVPTGCDVVATGLYNPRGITVAADGTVYIAEAGDGGDTADYATLGAGTPEATDPATTHGDTGRITAVTPDGEQSVFVDGLTSYVFGTEVVGPSGVAIAGNTMYVSIGGPGPQTADFPPADDANSVVAVDMATGDVTSLANLGEYERENNPDPNAIDSNLGGIAVGTDGLVYVVDSGGNDVFTIDPETGDLTLLAVLDGIPTPDGSANPTRGGAADVDPVPTGLVADPDGGVYVSLLTGAILWGVPGSAQILHVDPDGTVTEAASGLNLSVGVAVDSEGTIYATELSSNFFATPPAPGTVVRIGADGTPERILNDLFLPYGIAFGPDGSFYVQTGASAPPGSDPSGQVLKCDPDSLNAIAPDGEAATTPAAAAGANSADSVEISMVDLAFEPSDLTIAADTDATIVLTNNGAAPHNFYFDDLDIHSGTLSSGDTETLTVNLPAGTYTFYCNVPGHKQAGMVGTLTVE